MKGELSEGAQRQAESSTRGIPPSEAIPAATLTETEKSLLAIWSAVLNTDHIALGDEFLDVGGDSLAAMRCINRISATFGVELSLETFLLQSASIAQVASALDKMRDETAAPAVPESA